MPKIRGQHNVGYEDRRRALLARARERLLRSDGKYASLRELAAACQVSVPTLRHYFGGRDAIVVAILEEAQREGERHLARVRVPSGPFETSIQDAVFGLLAGLNHGLGDIVSLGLSEGLRQPDLGERFLALVLEPAVQATTRRLQAHIEAGEMRECQARTAALALVSPVILAALHQGPLGGAAQWPLQLQAFAAEHAEAFIRAYRR